MSDGTTSASDELPSSGELRERSRKALGSQRQPTVTVLSSLIAVQDELHYIPDEAIEETATHTNSTINDVWSVASFYTNFRFTPPGGHTIDVCWGPSCHLNGAQNVMMRVHSELGVEGEGETGDGKLTLRYSTCLGACALAPVIAVDHHMKGRMSPDSAAAVVDGLKGA
ncbi:MAG TPA: NAD(P)H-dependent oxidoreductase subunit E [Dehalococcoidia bacterium]|nr:NAD(P)H-dependent oxidoreductase subunit E [Chloroflexota bacterium]MDP5876616.1 NAD(P)H-dependent oxidoreductase subunit E [Dehalococcoidia bacterium]MDP6274138.1 NAD(P)H-dependent oxidoreductase subunit E [Dehalococcoidia bacterium]MDP7161755.1 NAD(P)H-dependent oxidoreductase subunit E [Dehalococcoidia bacterium]MDP7213200.1 NAD(P)H-dependent oxidoreductase subunit E [Dehalococcoidia bacterium]